MRKRISEQRQELRKLTNGELEERINDCKEELFNLRVQKQLTHLENPARIRQVRKEIARCKTITWERLLGIESKRSVRGGPK